jgi:hypothetical protein
VDLVGPGLQLGVGELVCRLREMYTKGMLFANVNEQLNPYWHWTSDELSASYAWFCTFDYGKSYEGSAVAVRRV